MYLTDDDVQEILHLLEKSTFDELTLETDRYTLVLRRSGPGSDDWSQERHTRPRGDSVESVPAIAPAAATAPADAIPDGQIAIRSPMPGTFYRAPKPGDPPFVEVGSRVKPDTVIGIIETMKLMNSVPAGISGTVTAIRTDNAQLVSRDAILMLVKTDG